MRTVTMMHSLIRPLGLVVFLFALGANAQMTTFLFPRDESARVALFAIDPEEGVLVSASPSLDAAGPPPVDRSQSVGEFTIDADNGDLQDAPADVPNSGGAIDRAADVADTAIDAHNGVLLSGPASSPPRGAVNRSGMVSGTQVDSANGALIHGPVRFIVPEPAAPAALLAAGLLLLGGSRSRQSATGKRSASH